MRILKINFLILSVLAVLFMIGCGSVDSPNWPVETHSDISATIKLIGEDTASYKTVFGTAFSSTDTFYPLLIAENPIVTPDSVGVSGNTSLQDYILTGGNIRVYYSGHHLDYRRYPNIGIRTGEEPMMNLITDGMLYYSRKHFSNARSSSGTKDDGLKKIRIATHNSGGIWNAFPSSQHPETNFAVGQSAENVKKFFRFDNHLAVVEFTPATLKSLLEYGVKAIRYRNGTTTTSSASDGDFLHWSGLTFTYDRGATSATANAFYYDAGSGNITNTGTRIRDVYLLNIPEYDPVNDVYDTNLRAALNNPQDSIAIILNGAIVPAQENTKIYGVVVDFLALTELAAQKAMNLSGIGDEKLLYIDAISRPNEAIDAILSNSNYTLYHRLQGRIRAVE